MAMITSSKGQDFIVREEGEKLRAYLDAVGIWTIGVGHTGWVDAKPVGRGMVITKEKSRQILQVDLKRFENAVNECVRVPLAQHQFDALVSLAFNIGEGAFRRSTLVKLLNCRNPVASEQFLVWKYAGGRPILLNRRKREKALFDGGVYA